MATKTKHPQTYRAREDLLFDGRSYAPGRELPVPRRPAVESDPKTVKHGGEPFYKDGGGGLFIRDDFARRWNVELGGGIDSPRAVLVRGEPAIDLDGLVARGLVWAPGDGPDETKETSR